MIERLVTVAAAGVCLAASAWASAQGTMTPDQQKQQQLKGAEQMGQRNDMQPMTAAQQAQYRAEYQAAKAKWAAMTPQQKSAAIASAREKKLSELSAVELVGQRDDMQKETSAQSAALKSQAESAKAQWDKMTPEQKQAVRKAAWAKKRSELSGLEAVGQRDDTYVLPW